MKHRLHSIWMLLVLAIAVAPAYTMNLMKGFDGSFHSLDEYTGKGKWTIVMMWASDCHACNAEAKQYVKFHQAHKEKDAVLLGISLDGNEKKAEAEDFIKRHNINFDNLIDEPENIMQMYTGLTGQAWVGTPTFLIYSPTGELRAAQVGAVPTHIIEAFIARETAAEAEKNATSNSGKGS